MANQRPTPVPSGFGRNIPHLADIIEQNIRTIIDIRKKAEDQRTLQERLADGITKFSGQMAFAYFHIVWFGIWIVINLGFLGIKPFDPFPFGF